MTTQCPSPLVRSTYVDGELAAVDVTTFEAHLDTCAACRTRIAALRRERLLLREVLNVGELAPIPAMRRPFGWKDLVLGFAGLFAVGSIASTVWSAIDDAVPSGLRWLSPLDPGRLFDSCIDLVVFLTREGSSMLTSVTQFAAAAVLLALFGWVGAALLKQRAGGAAMLSVLLLVLALPQLGHSAEIRRTDGLTTVAAGETVDDTLLAIGETVDIDGDVNGDLLAFARHVTVRGNVSGDVISGAETVDIQGTVGGNVFGGARAVTLSQARIRGNLYAGGREVSIAAGTEIMGNALAGGNSINVAGSVGVDLYGFAREVVIRGNVQRNVETRGSTVTVVAPARVGGNLTAHVDDPAGVRVSQGTVIGNVDTQVDDRFARGPRHEPVNKYLTFGFYASQVVRLGAAFVTGLLLFWLLPGLQTLSIASAGAALRATGIGLITAVTLPVVAFIACITVIGIPIGILVALSWAIGLYFAKTLVAQIVGRLLFANREGVMPHFAATLFVGLVIVLIAVNLPWIGWLVGLVATLLGLGLLVAYISDRSGRTLA
jgi:hypothetical protein